MMTTDCFLDELYGVQGHTVAVIHSPENGDDCYAAELDYDVLRWMDAARQNRCRALVLSTADFVQDAMRDLLPQIDFVINLSNAESSQLVAALCDFMGVPCVPSAVPHTLKENRDIIGGVAETVGLELHESARYSVRMYGFSDPKQDDTYTLVTPILQDPMTNEQHVLPTVAISPTGKRTIAKLDVSTENSYIELAKRLDAGGYCQIKAKMSCGEKLGEILSATIPSKCVLFEGIELLPDENFRISFNSMDEGHPLFSLYRQSEYFGRDISPIGFALFCCMQASSDRIFRMLSQRF